MSTTLSTTIVDESYDNYFGYYPQTHQHHHQECGIMNLNMSQQPGSICVCYLKSGMQRRIYFDSFGQVTQCEIQKYLNTKREYEISEEEIQRNTDIVQCTSTHVCDHLSLSVLRSLTREHRSSQDVLNELNGGYTQGNW